MIIIVYGKPSCPQCDIAKAKLRSAGKSFAYIDLFEAENKEDLDYIKAQGHRSVPIIMLNGVHVSLEEALRSSL